MLRHDGDAPVDWSAQLAACADEARGADLDALASRATNAELDVVERLAALELLRALHAETAVVLAPEQARELAVLSLGAENTRSRAAACALAAFGVASARAELCDRLAQGGGAANVALHGLRECARKDVLEALGARLLMASDPGAQERLAAAAQGVAQALGTRADPSAADQAEPLLALVRYGDLTATARRRLLLAVAALGSARAENELCDIACDAKADNELALEIANALRASPQTETSRNLEARLATSQLDASRREPLEATRDFLRARR
ncbi:MAG TPA: hypothetical protein VM509_16085 [Planctomycetota bacterium]|nr:hypothetical protein [Planctomycetota bacterium]